MASLSQIKLPNNAIYNFKDSGALQLTGGQVTGPVTFGDSVSIDEATLGDLVVNGSASFTNGAHGVIEKAKAADIASTLNALVKYSDTEGTFSDSNIYNTSNNLIVGSTTVPGNIQIGAKNDNYGILPNTNNYNQIGSSSLYWYRAYINNYYGTNSHVTNWDAGKNIGTASTSSAAATLGTVYFYNTCAAGGTQTKTLLSNGSATSNITITLPNTTGTLALTSQIPNVPSNIVNTITTTAGAHTAITSQKGNVSFNVPTKTSHLTNDSGFLTSITHQTIKQDGVTGATGNHFGTCSVAAGTAAKTVSITAGTPTLEAGLRVTVKFANANTAGTPTLNVNSLGAKNIFHNGAQITTGANKALLAGTVEFVYDGTQWQLVGNYIDTDTKAWGSITGKPTKTGSATTGISIAAHGTGTVIGVQSSTTPIRGVKTGDNSTTTASKVVLGTTISIPNVTSAGTASNWVFEDVTVPIKNTSATTVPTAASSATTVPIKNSSATSIPNVTAVGSGSASLTFTMDTTDTKKLKIAFSHTHVAPTLGTDISIIGVQSSTTSVTGVSGSTTVTGVQSTTTTASHVKSGGNGTAPTLGTAKSVPNVTSVTDVIVPIRAEADTDVPIKNASASTFVTGTTHTVTDNGHTHTI